MKTLLIVVQARVGGTRMPGKVLTNLLGQPLLLWVLDRLRQVQMPHQLVVACPETPENETIAVLCARHGYVCEQPPYAEDDVLGRYAWVAEKYNAAEIVRCTADCPTIDPAVVDALIAHHRHWRPHLAHTAIAADWPDGCDAEVISRAALEQAHAEATMESDREHVTPWIWRQSERFHVATLPCPFGLADVQWSVDTPYDFTLVEQLLKRTIARRGLDFGWRDLWATLLLTPSLAQQMQTRPRRNHAYMAQMAQEQGAPVQSWEQLRYGGSRSG